MCICMTCIYALYDGMCLKQGKFTLLDAPACDGYKLRVDVEESQLKAENAKLRELCNSMLAFILPSAKRFTLKERMSIIDGFSDRCRELGIEVEK